MAGQSKASVSFDLADSDGVFSASARSGRKLKLQVVCRGQAYNYDMPGDGTPVRVPANMGDGEYAVRVMEQVEGNTYATLESARRAVRLASEYRPFLVPNVYCDFDAGSECVCKAWDLVSKLGLDHEDWAKEVCSWVARSVSYDHEKASALSATKNYVPDPDRTFAERSGVCFDYASLACAMLRGVGIPTKLVTGYLTPDNLYHSWVVAHAGDAWRRYDPTLWSAGVDHPGRRYVYRDRFIF